MDNSKGRGQPRPLFTFDCETDPFLFGRLPVPFIWGLYDGTVFEHFDTTESFINRISNLDGILYAHNGGKFDFHFLLDWFSIDDGIKLIGSRIIEVQIGKATLRDSYPLIPEALAGYEKTKIDYAIFERTLRDKNKNKKLIRAYLRDDCIFLYQLVSGALDTMGSKATLASNALAYSKRLEIDPGRTNKLFDQQFRKFYAGGRCEYFSFGRHKNVSLYDIKSAYPWAMVHDHATGNEFRLTDKRLPKERSRRAFYDVHCRSFGAFWSRTRQGLSFPHIEGQFYVTGWELETALEFELIDRLKINACYEFYETINFKSYIDHWFEVKESAGKRGDKLQYLLAKKMLNALYGKLAQNPENFYEYKLVKPNTKLEKNWELHAESENWELHAIPRTIADREKFGDGTDTLPRYFNVATAASITGFVRAILLRGMSQAGNGNFLYCDTDSLYLRSGSPKIGNDNPGLGDFGLEAIASELWIAGKKLYAAKLTNGKEKIATKGVKLSFDEIIKICKGGEVEYRNPAPTFSIGKTPSFVVRKIAANRG